MLKTFKYKLNPNRKQAQLLSQSGRWKGHTKRVRGVAGAHLTHEHQVAAGRKAAGAGAKLVNHMRWHSVNWLMWAYADKLGR